MGMLVVCSQISQDPCKMIKISLEARQDLTPFGSVGHDRYCHYMIEGRRKINLYLVGKSNPNQIRTPQDQHLFSRKIQTKRQSDYQVKLRN
jgi:hypothetical protein